MGCLAIVFIIVMTLLGGAEFVAVPPVTETPLPPAQRMVYNVPPNATTADLEATVAILNARLNALGISPDVRIATSDRTTIDVFLPESDTIYEVVYQLAHQGYFELVDFAGKNPNTYAVSLILTTGQQRQHGVHADATPNPNSRALTTILDSSDVVSAEAFQLDNGAWAVQIDFNRAGASALESYTSAHYGEPLGVVLDRQLLAAPPLETTLSSGIVLDLGFPENDARYLAAILDSGTLPIAITFDPLS